jgi:hypothetical protein
VTTTLRTAFTVGLFTLTLAACSFSDNLAHCTNQSSCPTGHECYQGFCVRAPDTSKNSVEQLNRTDTGVSRQPDVTPDAGPPIMSKPVNTLRDAAQDGAIDAAADSGMDAAMSAAVDSGVDAGLPSSADAMPMSVIDAATGCEPDQMKACLLGPVTSTTAPGCNTGFSRCENGVYGACIADITPVTEQCNGLDDDCDGKADETTDTPCYPDAQLGCTLAADNSSATCQGLCALGRRLCKAGKLQACTGAIVPKAESCNSSGIAADENCDGVIDEGCACTGTQTRSCYTGPNGTVNVGKCKAGTQSCSNGMLGPCMGAVVPEPETCTNDNVDNDCDGVTDNIKDRGTSCSVASNLGLCRTGTLQCQAGSASPVCVTTPPSVTELCNDLDDDCDGKTDETFNLQSDTSHCGSCGKVCAAGEACCAGQCSNPNTDTNNCGGCGAPHICGMAGAPAYCCATKCVDFMADSANCGACGRACGSGETCCTGKCVNTKSDITNCGMCGMVCSTGMQPACCGGSCADLTTSNHCGSCERACGHTADAVACTCSVGNGVAQCVAPASGVCL